MPDVVVIRVPKEENQDVLAPVPEATGPPPPPPLPKSLLAKLRKLLFLPIRMVRASAPADSAPGSDSSTPTQALSTTTAARVCIPKNDIVISVK